MTGTETWLPERPCIRRGCRAWTNHLSGGCTEHRRGLPPAVSEVRTDLLGSDEEWRLVSASEEGGRAEDWFTGTKYGRAGGPSRVVYRPDGEIDESYPIYWKDPYRLSRVGGPARRMIDAAGVVRLEEWYLEDVRHRVDGPALIERGADGTLTKEWFIVGGHRCRSYEKFVKVLHSWGPKRLRQEFRDSPYRTFLDGGAEPETILAAIAGGVWSMTGIAEVLAGTPVEWVRSFESGSTR